MYRLTVLLLLLLSACGHKGPVRPLGEHLPVAPTGLQAQQRGTSVLLSWNLPTSNQDGSPLTDLQGFEVLRMDFAGDSPCATCRDTSRPIEFVDLEFLQQAQRSGDRILLADRAIEPQRAYRYSIVAVTTRERRGVRASIDAVTVTPLPPPGGLTAEGLDRLVRLSWNPAPSQEDGTLLGYRVFRTEVGTPFPLTPVQTQLVSEPRFEDLGVANDVPLRYAVRAVWDVAGREVASDLSEAITVTPKAGR